MKVQNWWVKPNLLTSGIDPTKELSMAAEQFPDEFTPMVYMSGDGHRKPPFQWSTRGVWPGFFKQFIDMNKICCHVETFSDEVQATSVPKLFEPVFHNHKVFGWEPEVFKLTIKIIPLIWEMRSEIAQGEGLAKSKIDDIAKEMGRVRNLGYLLAEGTEATRQRDQFYAMKNIDPIPTKALPLFSHFLSEYNRAAMQLRTVANDEIGSNIQRIIKQFPDHLHMITCGDAHILENPLYLYIQPPLGCFGVADEDQGGKSA
jgi:hypothetical protein